MKKFEELTQEELKAIYSEYCEIKQKEEAKRLKRMAKLANRMERPEEDGHTRTKRKFERYAENFLLDNGFTYRYVKQTNTKFVMDIIKDGFTYRFEADALVEKQRKYMEWTIKNWADSKKLQEFKAKHA